MIDRARLESNLHRLLATVRKELGKHSDFANTFPSPGAQRVSDGLYLANSSHRQAFEKICQSGEILSQDRLAASGGCAVSPTCAEALLETSGHVFLYLGCFRYPETSCGLLFKRTIEDEHRDSGCASPFDSGGLVRHITFPGGGSSLAFHELHELPIPGHGALLALTMDLCFEDPFDYVRLSAAGGLHPSPYGLTGGDLRRYTHEVRIPDVVPVRSDHLEAVFVAGNVTDLPSVEDLAEWCDTSAVAFERLDAQGGSDFERLHNAAIGYMARKLY